MALMSEIVRNTDRFFIDGEWIAPSSSSTFSVIDAGTEEVVLTVAEAKADDMSCAIAAARRAFDEGPWPRMSYAERASYLHKLAAALAGRTDDLAQIWSRETGVLHSIAKLIGGAGAQAIDGYANLANNFAFEETGLTSAWGGHAALVHEPVGVVGAIYPWNGPLEFIVHKAGPALIAGCTIIMKAPPQAPGATYVVAELVERIGFPPGVFNIVTADREVSEMLVTDPRVDKITFTGSTAAGRRIGALCGQRIARVTMELGGKSAAVVLDDADIAMAANGITSVMGFSCFLAGQVCAALTRVIVPRKRHNEMVDALAERYSKIRVGNQFDVETQMGPLATAAQRCRVEGYIAKGVAEGASLVCGGGRPKNLKRGWFVEPTIFANVDNSTTIAQEEIFGPVLTVIPAEDEQDAVRVANDSIYGLNAAVFTPDVDRALGVARQLRSGTVGHNGFKPDFSLAFGGFKQSGIGREGVKEGIRSYTETKTIILDKAPNSA